MATPKGYVCIVLHSHLPYVLGHGTWPFGSDWLCEAVSETYLPMLRTIEGLLAKGIYAKLSIGLTPVLTEQLADPRLPELFETYLQHKVKAAKDDQIAFLQEGFSHRNLLAIGWEAWFERARYDFYTRYNGDIVGAFRRLQDLGVIEILTSGATHGYLPLLGTQSAVKGQLETGVEAYHKHFGRKPRGIWLPECAYRPKGNWSFAGNEQSGYRPGLEEMLSSVGIDHFVADAHLITGQKARASYTARFKPYSHKHNELTAGIGAITKSEKPLAAKAPLGASRLEPRDASVLDVYRVENPDNGEGASVFLRDPEVALQVWSGIIGYPGDPTYLDFHKKHHPGGLRYWAVSGQKIDMADKLEYHPVYASERIIEHAEHFVALCRERLFWAEQVVGEPATITTPFDTELFGHWWFEGPSFLQEVLVRLAADPDIQVSTMEGRVAAAKGDLRAVHLKEGSWGEEGDHRVWLNDDTLWTWREVHQAESYLRSLIERASQHTGQDVQRALRQLTRSVALLESSDWQFLIYTESARSYAEERVITHAQDAKFLSSMVESLLKDQAPSPEDFAQLATLEERDRLFADIRPSRWA
jgi:1,4-alpha-glucan branching enzyme